MTDVRAVYEAVARDFDRDRSKSLMEKCYLDRVQAQLVEGASVLDLGCGSAEPIAKFFIDHGCRVFGRPQFLGYAGLRICLVHQLPRLDLCPLKQMIAVKS